MGLIGTSVARCNMESERHPPPATSCGLAAQRFPAEGEAPKPIAHWEGYVYITGSLRRYVIRKPVDCGVNTNTNTFVNIYLLQLI